MKDTKQTLIELKELIEDMIERLDAPPPAEPANAAAAAAPTPVPAAAPEGKGRLAIVVGHMKSARGANGVAPISESEYIWNKELAETIANEAHRAGHVCELFFRDGVGVPGAYDAAEAFDPDSVMELHFNAADGRARGTETLRGSQPEAAEWAQHVHDSMVSLYSRQGRLDRGIKKLKAGDRGHQSVSQLDSVPTVIIEPFFGDSPEDAKSGQEKKRELAAALASAFDSFMQTDATPGRSGGESLNGQEAAAPAAKLAPELRLAMGRQIVKFEARRDSAGRIAVYKLPAADGGGTYEVAGINDRYHPVKVRELRDLISAGNHTEAETEAAAYIATYTDRVDPWVTNPGVEFYLRDSAFNRGAGGAAKILQLALEVTADGKIGPLTKEAAAKAGADPRGFLKKLRAAREEYEVRYIGKRAIFWAGLNNRWNHALAAAETFIDKV